jgi:transcriptional regulator with GAF, ATPase, and Fis domain
MFPTVGRLELDELLAQLVERAQDVMATQGRLRGLLRANRMVTTDLRLPTLLRQVVEAGCELLDARYGALGVVAPDRTLEEFVHVGMDPADVERIGHLPTGHGVLGVLIDDPRPRRVDDIARDPNAVGFPPGHPPMHTFLGVPITVRGEVFGNLYLTEKRDGRAFTAGTRPRTSAIDGRGARHGIEFRRPRGDWPRARPRQVRARTARGARRPRPHCPRSP